MFQRLAVATAALALLGCGGCGDDLRVHADAAPPPDAGPDPIFPADYADTYTVVRECRSSTSHDFHHIKVLTDPAATSPYVDRDADFPVDSIVLKEEFDIGDVDCTDEIVEWTVMQRLPAGEAPELQLDWLWQKVDVDRTVINQNNSKCFGCHDDCDDNPADSYENTCTVPP